MVKVEGKVLQGKVFLGGRLYVGDGGKDEVLFLLLIFANVFVETCQGKGGSCVKAVVWAGHVEHFLVIGDGVLHIEVVVIAIFAHEIVIESIFLCICLLGEPQIGELLLGVECTVFVVGTIFCPVVV